MRKSLAFYVFIFLFACVIFIPFSVYAKSTVEVRQEMFDLLNKNESQKTIEMYGELDVESRTPEIEKANG